MSSSQGVRFMGKAPNGTAKAINVTGEGSLVVYLADIESALATLATAAKQDALVGLIGEKQASPTANTLLARLKSLEDKIAAIISDGIQLSGSEMEVYGTSLDDRPDATTVPIGATFTIVDASQEFRSWMSNGTNWGEEI